jgi:hypothetical protein
MIYYKKLQRNLVNKKYFILLTTALSTLQAHDYHNINEDIMVKSSLTYNNFKNSKQKNSAMVYSILVNSKINKHKIEIQNSYSDVDTIKPPLKEDLEINKTFLRYSYDFSKENSMNVSYIHIVDNLAPTDGGNIYGIGYIYRKNNFKVALNRYRSEYDDFTVDQSDINLQYHKKFGKIKTDIDIIGKYISLNDYSDKIFNKNASTTPDDTYFTTGIKLHASYSGYHIGVGGFFGNRLFAVMGNGSAVQHHAMRFNKTYFTSIGKKIDNYNLIFKYTYQEAEELPQDNFGVEMDSFSLNINYKF